MKKRKILVILIFLLTLSFNSIQAQTDIPVLTWRSHLSYNNIIDITSSSDKIYAAAENALFYVDQDEFAINKITKNDGLSDVAIGAIHYDPDSEVLIIGYANGNIDLLYENEVVNISTVKEASLIGGKRFYDIKVSNALIYLANDQGIFVLDADRKEITESYLNLDSEGKILRVSGVAFTSDSIYAATDKGLLSAGRSAAINRQDFNNWHRNHTDHSFSNIVNTTNGLTATSSNLLYGFDGNNWLDQNLRLAETARDLLFIDNSLLILTDSEINRVNGNSLELITAIDNSTTSSKLLQNSNGFLVWEIRDGPHQFYQWQFSKLLSPWTRFG